MWETLQKKHKKSPKGTFAPKRIPLVSKKNTTTSYFETTANRPFHVNFAIFVLKKSRFRCKPLHQKLFQSIPIWSIGIYIINANDKS